MEIIDRPLSEVIKEQKISEQLRKNSRGARRGSGNNSSRNRSNNNRGRTPRDGNRQQRGGRGRFRDVRGASGRRPPPARREPAPRLGRRGAISHEDSGMRRGVKSFGAARRVRRSGAERNDRERRFRRDAAVDSLRRSRR